MEDRRNRRRIKITALIGSNDANIAHRRIIPKAKQPEEGVLMMVRPYQIKSYLELC